MPSTRFPRASGSKEVSPGSQILLRKSSEREKQVGDKVGVGEKTEMQER